MVSPKSHHINAFFLPVPLGKYIDNELVDLYLVEKDVNLSDLKLQEEEVSDAKCIQSFEAHNTF